MIRKQLVSMFCLLFAAATVWGQTASGIDPEALIDQILSVDDAQRKQIGDLVMDAELIEGKLEDDGEIKEEHRFIKKIYIKYLEDTALFSQEYLEYYKDGELKEEKKLREEARKREEQRLKRKARNVSFNMLQPFHPEHREKYTIEYRGTSAEKIAGHVCHHFTVTANEEDEDLINGDYYFEADSFHLVKVNFAPAKLTKKLMFRLNQLDMAVTYDKVVDDYWLPVQFELYGKGKAALFFGVNFATIEYYRDHQINTDLETAMFEVSDGE